MLSLANNVMSDGMPSAMSLMKSRKRTGPKTDRWGTPDEPGTWPKNSPSTTTCWVLCDKKSLIQNAVFPWMPYLSSLCMSLLWAPCWSPWPWRLLDLPWWYLGGAHAHTQQIASHRTDLVWSHAGSCWECYCHLGGGWSCLLWCVPSTCIRCNLVKQVDSWLGAALSLSWRQAWHSLSSSLNEWSGEDDLKN